jgi:glycosyl transferase family 1
VKVCFVLPDRSPSGGAAVAAGYASGLAAARSHRPADYPAVRYHGVVAELVTLDELGDARGPYDVAIATWWETVPALWQLDTARRALLFQSFEQRFYDRDAPLEQISAETTLALPLDYIAVSRWLRDELVRLRPEARCRVVQPGIDKLTFTGSERPARSGPLEVLIEGQPTLPFKGVQQAVAAVRAMSEPARTTLVALDPSTAGDAQVDRVVGGLDAAAMAELYRASDVLLKLSRVEGLGLAPLEGFHCGLPCVVTPYTGHQEYVRHGENGIVVGFDDVEGTAGWLDLLARDRELLGTLSDEARRTAEAWPSLEESTRLLHEALVEIADSPPPTVDEQLLMRTLALGNSLGRARLSRGQVATEQALTRAEALVRELSESRDECAERLEESKAELERIRSGRAYRLAAAVKRTATRRGRG